MKRNAGWVAACGVVFLVSPAFASGITQVAHLNLPTIASKTGAGAIHTVKPGETIDVACAALADFPGADVRVVMTLTPSAGESDTGYQRLMATEEMIVHNTVHFRVPETAGIENHTVHLKVYVVGEQGAKSCNAGLIKIV